VVRNEKERKKKGRRKEKKKKKKKRIVRSSLHQPGVQCAPSQTKSPRSSHLAKSRPHGHAHGRSAQSWTNCFHPIVQYLDDGRSTNRSPWETTEQLCQSSSVGHLKIIIIIIINEMNEMNERMRFFFFFNARGTDRRKEKRKKK